MTAAEIVGVITNANTIGNNVFNFFDTYKKYENLLTTKKGSLKLIDGNDLIDRADLIDYIKDPEKPQYRRFDLLPIYDEIKFRMTWKDIACIYTSSHVMYQAERYYLSEAIEKSESVISFLDMETGERLYIAADQVNTIVQYNYDEKGPEIDPKTGIVDKNVYINRGVDRKNTEKHRLAMNYRD